MERRQLAFFLGIYINFELLSEDLLGGSWVVIVGL